MDLSVQSRLLPSHIHVPLEDRTRLYKQMREQLRIGQLTQRQRQIVFKNVSHGLKQLSVLNSNAHDWANIFEQLAVVEIEEPTKSSASSDIGGPHPILQVLIDQPAPSRTAEQRKRCVAIGALAFMAIAFKLRRTPSQFSDHLRQLFRSANDGWIELCELDFLNAQALEAWVPVTTVAVVRDFRSVLLDLHRVGIPTISGFLTPASLRAADLAPAQSESDEFAEPAHQSKTAPKKKQPDDVTERADLFELQKQSDCQEDLVDGYRLPLHWSRLHPSELRPVLQRLNTHLKNHATDEDAWRQRAHAAARYVSLFAGMSLKKCLRLPLRRRGSMRLDIAQGVIRRDLLLVAPRMDRKDRKRIHGRWWRTRLPYEVRLVLQQLMARHPDARTLGELLKAEGLDHEACQRLLNDEWPTSHRAEDTRFALSLRPCLLSLGVHPALVARVTGDTMVTPASDHYYLSISEAQVHEAVWTFCRWAGLTPPDPPVRDRRIGTPKALSVTQFQELVAKLNQKVLTARNEVTPKSPIEQIIKFHNLYTAAVALQIVWGVGGRGDRVPSLTFERLFASTDYLAVSDRRVDRYSRQRIGPSTQVLTATRCHYLEHLRSLSDSLQRACDQSAEFVLKVAAGARPHESAFFIYEETRDGWTPRTLQRQDLVALAEQLGVTELNAARHFWFTELVERNVAQAAIEALLGHHLNGAEAFGYSSGISVREVCDYLRPILEQVHQELGFKPLAGRGRQASRFLTVPEISAKRTLRPLPSVLLQRKLDAQDLLIDEVGMYEQDPPSTTKTLVAHSHLARLKQQYLNCGEVRTRPAGALLFCLIAMDLVLATPEQEALLTAALDNGLWIVGQLVVIEATDGSRPVAQRLVSKHTVAAAHVARIAHQENGITLAQARSELHRLLKQLDPGWPAKTSEDSAKLFATMAGHWAAIEIPPGSLFSVFHKAPFIPVHDLARLHHRRTCVPTSSESETSRNRRWKAAGGFEASLEIVNHWANKDLPLGEEGARRKGCLQALRTRRSQSDVDEVEQLLIDLLCADLSPDAPYRTLSPTVIPEYGRGYATYFSFVRREGTVQLDPETLMEAYFAMGGTRDFKKSCPARWQMLHICAFLGSRGCWIPTGFLSTQGKKTPALPRLPAYTSQAEIAAARRLMEHRFEGRGGTYAFAGARLELQRAVPLRVSEPRYSRPADFDRQAKLFHITTTGHDHLKSEHSRGSVLLNEQLAKEMSQLCERRQAIGVGPETLLFCDAHLAAPYAAFDTISDALRDSVITVTGCPQFRQHDLRAAAATDAAFNVETELTRVCAGSKVILEPLTAQSVTRKHARFAWASRLARHASPLTTLRYYICSGLLDLRQQLELADAGMDFSGKYVAELLGKKAQALYAAAHRARKTSQQTPGETSAVLHDQFDGFLNSVRQQLPTPILGSALDTHTEKLTAVAPRSNGSRLIEAALLSALGMPVEAASDATQLPVTMVTDAFSRFRQRAGELGIRTDHKDQTPLLASALGEEDLTISRTIRSYASWLTSNKAMLQRAALSLLPSLGRSGSRLILKSDAHLLDLLPVVKEFHAIGFRVVFRLGPNRLLQQYPAVEAALRDTSIEVHLVNAKEPAFATSSFLFKDEMPALQKSTAKLKTPAVRRHTAAEKASPRSYGRAGRLALAGLILGLSL